MSCVKCIQYSITTNKTKNHQLIISNVLQRVCFFSRNEIKLQIHTLYKSMYKSTTAHCKVQIDIYKV